MKIIVLVLAAMFIYLNVFAQLSDDSLKNICLRDYMQRREEERIKWNSEYTDGKTTDTVKELFKGYFTGVKILLLEHYVSTFISKMGKEYIIYDAVNADSKLYFLDAYTGQSLGKKNYISFNKIMSGGTKKTTTLDKCYLYLFINGLEPGGYGLTQPDRYQRFLNKNSIFLENKEWAFNHYSPMRYPPASHKYYEYFRQIIDGIEQSNNGQIYMYVHKFKERDDTTYGYRFQFNNNGLESVTPLQFE